MTIKPAITEKAARLAEGKNPIYTFVVGDLTKTEVKQAIKKQYNVNPIKVTVVTLPKKKVTRRGMRPGARGGLRKAMVFLKPGEKITLA
jgi:large subunit ribosomal protein L23